MQNSCEECISAWTGLWFIVGTKVLNSSLVPESSTQFHQDLLQIKLCSASHKKSEQTTEKVSDVHNKASGVHQIRSLAHQSFSDVQQVFVFLYMLCTHLIIICLNHWRTLWEDEDLSMRSVLKRSDYVGKWHIWIANWNIQYCATLLGRCEKMLLKI